MVNSRLEYDQSGSVFVDNDFRKIGLVSDPLGAASSYDDYGSAGTDTRGIKVGTDHELEVTDNRTDSSDTLANGSKQIYSMTFLGQEQLRCDETGCD